MTILRTASMVAMTVCFFRAVEERDLLWLLLGVSFAIDAARALVVEWKALR